MEYEPQYEKQSKRRKKEERVNWMLNVIFVVAGILLLAFFVDGCITHIILTGG